MGLLDWLRRRTPASVPEPEEQQVVTHVPALSDPVLLFMENPAFVSLLEEVPSWQVVHARSFGEFSPALPQRKYAMLIALSPLDPGARHGPETPPPLSLFVREKTTGDAPENQDAN